MDNYQLLQQILSAGETNHEEVILSVSVHYPNNAITLTNTIGPIEPRSRMVEFSPVGDADHHVKYWEVTHGMAQPGTDETIDVTVPLEVERLIDRIWAHLKS